MWKSGLSKWSRDHLQWPEMLLPALKAFNISGVLIELQFHNKNKLNTSTAYFSMRPEGFHIYESFYDKTARMLCSYIGIELTKKGLESWKQIKRSLSHKIFLSTLAIECRPLLGRHVDRGVQKLHKFLLSQGKPLSSLLWRTSHYDRHLSKFDHDYSSFIFFDLL